VGDPRRGRRQNWRRYGVGVDRTAHDEIRKQERRCSDGGMGAARLIGRVPIPVSMSVRSAHYWQPCPLSKASKFHIGMALGSRSK
jgi:hypothetical protein